MPMSVAALYGLILSYEIRSCTGGGSRRRKDRLEHIGFEHAHESTCECLDSQLFEMTPCLQSGCAANLCSGNHGCGCIGCSRLHLHSCPKPPLKLTAKLHNINAYVLDTANCLASSGLLTLSMHGRSVASIRCQSRCDFGGCCATRRPRKRKHATARSGCAERQVAGAVRIRPVGARGARPILRSGIDQ